MLKKDEQSHKMLLHALPASAAREHGGGHTAVELREELFPWGLIPRATGGCLWEEPRL